MPTYKVLKPGFFGGRQYDPEGKRPVLHTDKPFPTKDKKEQVPSWLEPITETEAERKKQQAAEKKNAAAAAKKAEQDQKDIADASLIGEGESAQSATVETL